ncbi:MAG: hypothetical protein MZV64_18265 [Ignavibacteriales bacterium]|nr:hypothetical protein [Ignavibacteriales bacterium]
MVPSMSIIRTLSLAWPSTRTTSRRASSPSRSMRIWGRRRPGRRPARR